MFIYTKSKIHPKNFKLLKSKITEPDIIGGQGPLTEEEESAISKYLADKKVKEK